MIGAAQTIPALFHARVRATPDLVALQEFVPSRDDGNPGSTGTLARRFRWREWRDVSTDVSGALVWSGAGRGDAVAIMAGNSTLWPIADLGVILAGLTSVGIRPMASVEEVRALIRDCYARVVIVDSEERLDTVRAAIAGMGDAPLVVAAIPDERLAARMGVGSREVSWASWLASGRDALVDGSNVATQVARRGAVTSPDDIAILMYTSGSTGEPKGARLSHRYVIESARSIRDTLGLTVTDSSLALLPFAHASERIFGLYTRIACGMTATLVRDSKDAWEAARTAQPTLVGGVPHFFEKIHEALLEARRDASPPESVRWDRALALGAERAMHRRDGEAVPPTLNAEWREAAEVISPVLARCVGPRLRLATSGGAPLPMDVAEYLDACGLTVLGAYGQTEHLCVTCNRPERYRHDSVGVAMPGTTIRIADDGEIVVRRSPLTFSGYLKRPEETVEAFTRDGSWLCTGDLGTLDDAGFLRVTGRKKEVIVLSTGRKVAPAGIEARLCESPLIAHAMLYGDGHPYLTALLTLRTSFIEPWQREQGMEGGVEAAARHPKIMDAIRSAVERVNGDLARPEQVRKFVIASQEATGEGGELLASQKLRRVQLSARYGADLEALYREEG